MHLKMASKGNNLNIQGKGESAEEDQIFCDTNSELDSGKDKSIFIRYKKTNIYLEALNTANCLIDKTILEKMFHAHNPHQPATLDTVSDHVVDYVIRSASEEYLDVADTVWSALQELIMEGVNIQLQSTLDMRCRIRLHRRSDDTLIKWIASRSAQGAICLVMNGLMHLLRMNRLPNSALLVSLAARSRQMVVDSVWEELHHQLPERSESVLRHLWRECIRMVKHHLDVYVKTTTLSWVRDRSPTLAGIPSCNISCCRAALLITASSIVLEVCQSELIRYFVTSSNVPKEKFEDLIRVILLLPQPLLYSMSAWVESHLWCLVNKIVRLPSAYHVRRIVLSVVRQVMKHAHAQVRKALPEKHNQVSEDLFVDGIVDYIVSYLQQRLLVHNIGTNSNTDDLLKEITIKAYEISDTVVGRVEKEAKGSTTATKKTMGKNLSDLVIESSKISLNERFITPEPRIRKFKLLHNKNMKQILSTVTLMAESMANEGAVPQKNLLAEMGFNVASQAAATAVQDMTSRNDVTPNSKCRIFLEYTCSSLKEVIRQKGLVFLDAIAKVNEMTPAQILQKMATTFVLELELLHEVSDKLDEILEADRQDSLRRTIEAYPVQMCKLDELVIQERNWVVDGIMSAVTVEVDNLLKDDRIPSQRKVEKFVRNSILNLLPEAIRELELRLRFLFESSNVTSYGNLNVLMRELASHVFYGSCMALCNEARKEEVAGEACVSLSATCCKGEMKMQTSNEMYTALKNHRLHNGIVEVQNDIARQIVKVVEEETVMINIGRLDIDTMEKMDELAFSIVVRIFQLVEEDINSAGPDLRAVWESPLLERILRESARLLRCWEYENKIVIDALGQMVKHDMWFVTDDPFINYPSDHKLNNMEGMKTPNTYELLIKNEGEVTTKGEMTPKSESGESVAFLEEQVVHGIINRILTTQILAVFESKLAGGGSYPAESGDETHCICSEEDRQFIWDITSLVFPLSSFREADEVEKLHLSVHKFAHSVFSSSLPRSKMKMDEDDLELLQWQLKFIIESVLKSKSVQSQLVLDTMSSTDSLNALNSVVVSETTKLLMSELSSHYDRSLLGILEQTHDEIIEYVRYCMVNHFPLLSQNLSQRMIVSDMDTRAMKFDDASGQLITSLVDDLREYVFLIIDDQAEFRKGIDLLKENLKVRFNRLNNVANMLDEFLENGKSLQYEPKTLESAIINVEKSADADEMFSFDESKVESNLHKKPTIAFQVHDILFQVRGEVRKQLISTRLFVSCLVRMARKHLRDTATKLKNKMRLDACFYVYEILPPPMDTTGNDNSGLNRLKRGRSLHSAISSKTVSDSNDLQTVPHKIVSLDGLNQGFKTCRPKFRSLDDISPMEIKTSITGSAAAENRLNSSMAKSRFSIEKDVECREEESAAGNCVVEQDTRSRAMCSSIECFLTQQMLKTSMVELKETYLTHEWSSRQNNVPEIKDTIANLMLRQVVDNLKQEVFIRDLSAGNLAFQEHTACTSTSLPMLNLNCGCVHDILQETVNNLVTHVESHTGVLSNSNSSSREDTITPLVLSSSEDLLLASIISQAKRVVVKWVSINSDSPMPGDVMEKNSKLLARKMLKEGKVLLKGSKPPKDVKDLVDTIITGVQEEIDKDNLVSFSKKGDRSVSRQIHQVTIDLLKMICDELKNDRFVESELKVPRIKLKLNPSRRYPRKTRVRKSVTLTPLVKLPQLVQLEDKIHQVEEIFKWEDMQCPTVSKLQENCYPLSTPNSVAKWVVDVLKTATDKVIEVDGDLHLLTMLDETIIALTEEKEKLKMKLESLHIIGNHDNPGPKRKMSFSALKPLLDSEATSSDIFEAVLDLVKSNPPQLESKSEDSEENFLLGQGEIATTSTASSSSKLKPIFEGEEIGLDETEVALGLSAISFKHPDVTSVAKQELVGRNSFRNLLAPELSVLPVIQAEDNCALGSNNKKSLSKIKCLIKRAATIQKTNLNDPSRSSFEDIAARESSEGNLHTPDLVEVHSYPQDTCKIEDVAGPSTNISVKSNGVLAQRSKEHKIPSARGTVNEKSDTTLELGSKSALMRLVGVKKEQFLLDSMSKVTKSLGGAESLELSRIEELVSNNEVEIGMLLDDSENEEETVVSIIEADIENCPQIPEKYANDD
uniref:Uncharacterized protein n=1 Tax=Strigamia maritima TaxID=126957 RepID=T1J9Q4_STRMM